MNWNEIMVVWIFAPVPSVGGPWREKFQWPKFHFNSLGNLPLLNRYVVEMWTLAFTFYILQELPNCNEIDLSWTKGPYTLYNHKPLIHNFVGVKISQTYFAWSKIVTRNPSIAIYKCIVMAHEGIRIYSSTNYRNSSHFSTTDRIRTSTWPQKMLYWEY